jgi:DNA-binding transcriptional ArsR family regulator
VTDDSVARQLADLTRRVTALEAAAAPPLAGHIAQRLQGGGAGSGTVSYAGVGGWDGRTLAWQAERDWDDIRSAAAEPAAAVLAALGNPTRVRITAELLRRDRTTAELAALLDQPSPGQLFHHLKELLAAGLVHQPLRGTYAVREQHVVPLLAVLCAVHDLRPPVAGEPS